MKITPHPGNPEDQRAAETAHMAATNLLSKTEPLPPPSCMPLVLPVLRTTLERQGVRTGCTSGIITLPHGTCLCRSPLLNCKPLSRIASSYTFAFGLPACFTGSRSPGKTTNRTALGMKRWRLGSWPLHGEGSVLELVSELQTEGGR